MGRLVSIGGRGRAIAAAVAAGAVAAQGAGARAQTNGGGSQFNAGYGASSGQFSNPVNVSRNYDANGNKVIVDGVTKVGEDGSVFYTRRTGGAGDSYSGAGAVGYGTAIGNNLVVNVQGNNNTVVVNSTQTNTGAVTAKTVLNGKVNIEDGGDGAE